VLDVAAAAASQNGAQAQSAVDPGEGLDPILFELIRNGLGTVCDEMTATILRTSRSQIAKDTMDFSTALCDTQGRMIAEGLALPFQLGSIPSALEGAIAKFDGKLEPGDLIVSN